MVNLRHPYDSAKPWERPWHDVTVGEKDFWYKEFERQAFLIITKVAELGMTLGGDAPTAHGPVRSTAASSTSRHDGAISAETPPLREQRAQRRAVEQPPILAIEDVPRQWKKANNQGAKLRGAFQHGKCGRTVGGRCAKGSNCAHQCAICLGNRHGAMDCAARPAAPKTGGRARRGKNRMAD